MKRWVTFLMCLLLSGLLWFFHMLSQSYADLVSVPVTAVSNIEGRSSVSGAPVMVSARCSAPGFSLLYLLSRKKPVPVTIDASDFQHISDDRFQVPSANMAKYVPQIFGADLTLESFVDEHFVFSFAVEQCKRVPVLADDMLSYVPQYMAVGKMAVSPDSVTVYGEPLVLDHIDGVHTEQIILNDISTDQRGIVALVPPGGARLSIGEVTYMLDVSRFVELPVTVPIFTANVPEGRELLVFPPFADVICKCAFPVVDDEHESIRFSIDYNDFANSISGRCLPHCDLLPQGVIDYVISPEVFDCIEQ